MTTFVFPVTSHVTIMKLLDMLLLLLLLFTELAFAGHACVVYHGATIMDDDDSDGKLVMRLMEVKQREH